MSTVAWDPSERGRRLHQILREIDAAVGRGEPPVPDQWAARHPEFAREIGDYFTAGGRDGTATDRAQGPGVGARVGDYELLERLGRGGEGMVFRARHRQTDHVVALKLVFADDEAARRIREETRALAGLRHPHIVPVFFFGEDRGICYYTMAVMEGGSLEDHLSGYRDAPREAAAVVVQVAHGVHHAHSRGILHLDLKPANVLLDDAGQPHVSDFGLARRLYADDPPRPGSTPAGGKADGEGVEPPVALTGLQVRGTAPFMSPEMASGEAAVVTTAADIYGLGAILYTLLTGHPPFRRDTFNETLRAVLWDRPTPPGAVNRKVDRELEQVCQKCLHKDPARRYGSADALANDLGRWLRGEPTLAGRPTVGKHVRFWLRRHPLRVAAVGLVALAFWLAAAAGSIGALHAANRREARRLAREVQTQLRMIQYEVEDVAHDPDLRARWKGSLDDPAEQRRAFDAFLARVSRTYRDRFGMTGGNPLINVLLMSDRGVILADTADDGRSIGKAFPSRDYFRALMAPEEPPPREAVAVSRAFRSVVDGRYKIAVSTRVWDGEHCLGLLVANVTLGPKLVLVDMTDEPEGAAVVSPMDWTYPGPDPPAVGERRPYLTAFHRTYARPAVDPLWPDPFLFPRLADFEHTPGLTIAEDAFRDGGVTDYHRVGTTPLVVLLWQPYPRPARWLLDLRLAPWAAAGVATLVLMSLAVTLRRARARSTGRTGAMRIIHRPGDP